MNPVFCVMHEMFHTDENNILLTLLSCQKMNFFIKSLMNRKKRRTPIENLTLSNTTPNTEII